MKMIALIALILAPLLCGCHESPEDAALMFLQACNPSDPGRGAKLLRKYPKIANHRFGTHVGQTTLHMCVGSADERMVKLLIDAGADVNALESRKMTPLDYMIYWGGNPAVYRLLVSHGAHLGGPRSSIDPLWALQKCQDGTLALPMPETELPQAAMVDWLRKEYPDIKLIGIDEETPTQGIKRDE